MATYAEFLKSQGASDEEIKILDTPVSRRAYEKLEGALMTATDNHKKAVTGSQTLQKWYNEEALPEYKRMEAALIVAKGNEARAREIIKTATDQGLIEIAKAAGFNVDEPPPAAKKDEVDTSKFVTHDRLIEVAQLEGDAIAIAQDISAEHMYLFGTPIRNFREMRREATERKVPVEQVWMEKYKVPEARTAKEAAAQKERDDKIRLEERQKFETEYASKYGDPNSRPPLVSTNILAPRPAQGRDKQPWESNEDALANSRVARALKDSVTRTN